MQIKSADYIASCVKESNYPEKLENVEIAFVGRSNVGKSSLINSLVKRKNLARTSKTPGRTQLVNFFLINKDRYFVDLPGYGFAKVPANIKKNWGNIMEEYLNSERRKVVFVLLDIRRIPSGEDFEMLKYLEHYEIEYYIIFTKSDKLSNNERFKQLKEIKKKLVFENEDVFFHSSLKNTGREEILEFIESLGE
ncbi:ribosome biogenesis GTP-binding protein YihA/YsxC [Pseudostreptobacillus hongkongensis]|uniref:ribosome biogenesis GTP-binding protein YihA/YsxC n=1 Tax=Pseudostreptobacillus hongkongensis TaxID=1162717 RepID=UPI000835EA7B|nr:ribosome biogenesis GTP-binding protein YihA/YsxC [Pseudostreptobacillus hongkongensis]